MKTNSDRRKMKSKPLPIRPLGQRSLPSTFIFRSSDGSSNRKENVDVIAGNKKGSGVSLSEFLNRKLHRSSVLPGSSQRKERAFSSPVCNAKGKTGGKVMGGGEKDFALEVVLKQFKLTKMEKENGCSFDSNVLGNSILDEYDTQESRKRKRVDYQESGKKVLAVLGDDSERKRRGTRRNLASNEKPKLLFNHYANGSGWWDCDMEGVDNEEVGCAEVWEGMGSTTLGGLDWH